MHNDFIHRIIPLFGVVPVLGLRKSRFTIKIIVALVCGIFYSPAMATKLNKKTRGDDPKFQIKLLRVNEAADRLSMGLRTLQEKVANREISVIKIGKSLRFHPDDIEEFINNCRVGRVDPDA